MVPPGFVVPAQPVERDRPPAGADWVHEIKHRPTRSVIFYGVDDRGAGPP
jgi:hypothetical protein